MLTVVESRCKGKKRVMMNLSGWKKEERGDVWISKTKKKRDEERNGERLRAAC